MTTTSTTTPTISDYEQRERLATADLAARLEPIAAAISWLSGQQWQVAAGCEWYAKIEAAPYGFGVSLDRHNRRFVFSGNWPRDTNGCEHGPRNGGGLRIEKPTVSVSADRPAGKIAADVWRRLGHWYLPQFDQAQQAADLASGNATRQQLAADKLAAILGARAQSYGNQPSPKFVTYRHGVRAVDVAHDGQSAAIEISSVPIELAAEILAMLADRLPAGQL